jgi:UDP-N-acetylglucosamine 2-epimerase (non-hydrolysing)
MIKISFILGTRPEAIKLCPLILSMKDHAEIKTHVCVTGQHREMMDQVLNVFGVVPDTDLSLMKPNQSLAELTSRAIAAIDRYLIEYQPQMIIVQGDTTTVFCASLCAFYHRIPVGHVEAGLRTGNKFSPFPEEMNRVLTTRLSDLHFAPTATSRDNLLKDGVAPGKIFVTGNTVIDALHLAVDKIKRQSPIFPETVSGLMNSQKPMVLITGHRRENFGRGFQQICLALAALASRFPKTDFIYPVHLNPNVQKPVYELLGRISNVHLISPVGYLQFVALMEQATLILTDSGGVQEEAPSLGKPVLVMRDTTERPEAVKMGTVKLVGTNIDSIVNGVDSLLTNKYSYDCMARSVNPYGDGKACGRILNAILSSFRHPLFGLISFFLSINLFY